VIRRPLYNPHVDGNVFRWILKASQTYRELRRTEDHAAKEATAVIKRLDRPKVENQKW
jgi:hypothetical protein